MGLYRGYIGAILGLYRGYIGVILGLYTLSHSSSAHYCLLPQKAVAAVQPLTYGRVRLLQ